MSTDYQPWGSVDNKPVKTIIDPSIGVQEASRKADASLSQQSRPNQQNSQRIITVNGPSVPSYNEDHHSPTSAAAAAAVSSEVARYASRPLATTKRAEQNRQAQRAFRQRKEKYINELESRCRDLEKLQVMNEGLRKENLELRDYIMALQAKLIEVGERAGLPVPPGVKGTDSSSTIDTEPVKATEVSGGTSVSESS